MVPVICGKLNGPQVPFNALVVQTAGVDRPGAATPHPAISMVTSASAAIFREFTTSRLTDH